MLGEGRAFGISDASGTWIASALVLPLGPAISWISMVLVTRARAPPGPGLSPAAAMPRRDRGERRGGRPRCHRARAARLSAAGISRRLSAVALACRGGSTALGRPAAGDPRAARNRLRTCRGSSHATKAAPALPAATSSSTCSRAPRLWRASPSARTASLAGYALGRNGHSAMHIGPVVADDAAIGLALLSSAMAATSERVILDVPDRHRRDRGNGSAPKAPPRRAPSCACCAGTSLPIEDAGKRLRPRRP